MYFYAIETRSDFKIRSKEYFGKSDNDPIYSYDNLIEITKDRELGAVEMFVCLYFEKESKRLIEHKGQDIVYGWDKEKYQVEGCQRTSTNEIEIFLGGNYGQIFKIVREVHKDRVNQRTKQQKKH